MHAITTLAVPRWPISDSLLHYHITLLPEADGAGAGAGAGAAYTIGGKSDPACQWRAISPEKDKYQERDMLES